MSTASLMNGDELLSIASEVLGSDAQVLCVLEMRERLQRTSARVRGRLLELTAREVSKRSEIEREDRRALLSRLIAALLPESRHLVEATLGDPRTVGPSGELQFSLFVALSDIGCSPLYYGIRETIAALMKRYLMSIEDDSAQAAWMAADALGEHWPLEAGLPILLEVVEKALYTAGREAALHGLSHALARATKRQQWEIVGVLRKVAADDQSESVRRYAEAIQGELRGL